MSSAALLEAVHEALIEKGVVVPVSPDAAEQRRWTDCDLASFAENRLGEVADPRGLDEPTRQRWTETALEEPLPTPSERPHESCYWILRDGTRVGTIAISRFCLGSNASAYSVYVHPPYRGIGIMPETLRALHAELERHGMGLELETGWIWQRAVRFYLRLGFWLRSWKRDLSFVWPSHSPSPIIAVGEDEAAVSVEREGRSVVLARARRDRGRLIHHDEEPDLPEGLRHFAYDARTTLALAIALEGWPLIRSEDHWQQARHSDAVHPEALAERIMVWEAWAAKQGWRIATPRIPGVQYRTWSEVEAG